MGPFRVVVTGVRHFHTYARLRDLLDKLLANRLPNVVILSRCGRGTDALATSYAVERGLRLVPHPLNLERDRTEDAARERRNARLVAEADAAVVVWDRHDRDLVENQRVVGTFGAIAYLRKCRRSRPLIRPKALIPSKRPDRTSTGLALVGAGLQTWKNHSPSRRRGG
jgi:hypothetical protein